MQTRIAASRDTVATSSTDQCRVALAVVLLSFVCVGGARVIPARAADHLFVVTGNSQVPGNCAAVSLAAPWAPDPNLESLGILPSVRHFGGRHYVINRTPSDNVQVIDPLDFQTLRTISLPAGSDPQDILVLDDGTAFVSLLALPELWRVRLSDGARLSAIDLSQFADADGSPEASMMERDGDHVFVQLQRRDGGAYAPPVAPSYLAVVSVTANALVDVDAGQPGTQAIQLTWTLPSFKMQIEGRRLYVSEPGVFFDEAGGLEAIDLDTLQPLGFVMSEQRTGLAQMGAFLLVSPTLGYVVQHTDLLQSSHLVAFDRTTGGFIAERFVCFGLVERLAFDATTGLLYFPDSEGSPGAGMRVFDAATGAQLTASGIDVGGPPVDLVIARGLPTAGPAAPGADGNALGARLSIDPNPMLDSARIELLLPDPTVATVQVFDARGRAVRTLAANLPFAAGATSLRWDGRDDARRRLPRGVYFVRLAGGEQSRAIGVVTLR